MSFPAVDGTNNVLYVSIRVLLDKKKQFPRFHFRLKGSVCRKYGLSSQPRLVDIIAAVPTTHKKVC